MYCSAEEQCINEQGLLGLQHQSTDASSNGRTGTGARVIINARVAHVGGDDLLVTLIATGVSGSQNGRALFAVPGPHVVVRHAADGDGVDTAGVSVAVAIVFAASVSGSPNKDAAKSVAPFCDALKQRFACQLAWTFQRFALQLHNRIV